MPIGSDVANIPATNPPTSPTYSTVEHVARVMQRPIPGEAEGEGIPERSDWEEILYDMEGVIDKATGTSWRPRRVRLEYHPRTGMVDEHGWIRIQLKNTPVKTLDSGAGDSLEVRMGDTWEDWLATKTQGLSGQFWVEEPSGILRLRRGYFLRTPDPEVRLSYRYGESDVPYDIRRACALLAAVEIASGASEEGSGHGGDSDTIGLERRVQRWEEQANAILAAHQHYGGT